MFEVLNIPLPPAPGGALGMGLGVVAFLCGLALLLLGRVVVWRIASALCLGAAGAVAAAVLATKVEYDPVWPAVICGVCLALIGLALAQGVWTAALSMFLAGAAELALLHRLLPDNRVDVPAGFEAAGLTFGQWARQAARTVGEWLRWMIESDPMLTVLTGAAAALAALVLGWVQPVAVRIFSTAAAGAALVVGGAALTLTSLIGPVGLTAGYRGWVVLGACVVVAIAGMAYQVRGHGQRAKAKAEGEAKPDTTKAK